MRQSKVEHSVREKINIYVSFQQIYSLHVQSIESPLQSVSCPLLLTYGFGKFEKEIFIKVELTMEFCEMFVRVAYAKASRTSKKDPRNFPKENQYWKTNLIKKFL